jgi:hypothetical protein
MCGCGCWGRGCGGFVVGCVWKGLVEEGGGKGGGWGECVCVLGKGVCGGVLGGVCVVWGD